MPRLELTKQKKIILLCLGVFAAALLVIMGVLMLGNGAGIVHATGDNTQTEHISVGLATPDPNDTSAKLSAIVSRTTMLEGVTVGGIPVGNMTIAEAKAAVEAAAQGALNGFSLTLTDGETTYPVTAEELQLVCDTEASVVAAYELLRDETAGYDAVAAEVERIKTSGQDFPLALTCSDDALRVYIADLAVDVDVPAVSAGVTGGETGIVYTPEANGVGVDQEVLFGQMQEAIANGAATLAIPKTELIPALTVEMLQTKYVLRGGFTTNFKNSSSNRKFNVRKAAGLVNGTVLKPDAVFSANDTLGVRTLANGWKNAPAYIAGTHDDQPGGGVCQVSSTLYNAVVLSDLEIVFRRNHSMPVAYVKKGRDATINSIGNVIDFQFKNNTSDDLIIVAYTDGNELTIQIYGVPFANDEYDAIDIRTKQVSHTSYTTEVVEEDPNKDVGYEEILREGQDGYVVVAYKQYLKNGKLVREEELNRSTYKMFTEQKKVGIRATPEPTTAPTSTPTTAPVTDPPAAPTAEPTAVPQNTPEPTAPPTTSEETTPLG